MMRKKILITIVIILALSFTGTPAFAYNYTINGEGYDDLPVYTTDFISPLKGALEYSQITGVYNEPRSGYFHQGPDMRTTDANYDYTHDVYPVTNGTVVGISTSGNKYVIVEHYKSYYYFYSIYMHLNTVAVNVGDGVDHNTPIGQSGNSGADAPHLHFEINSYFDKDSSGRPYLSTNRKSFDAGWVYQENDGVYRDHPNNWVDDLTGVKDITISNGVLNAKVFGIYDGTRVGPYGNPRVYWKYDYETSWNWTYMKDNNYYNYSWDYPSNSSANAIHYVIYFESKWYDGKNIYNSHAPAIFRDAAPDPDNWSYNSSQTTPYNIIYNP